MRIEPYSRSNEFLCISEIMVSNAKKFRNMRLVTDYYMKKLNETWEDLQKITGMNEEEKEKWRGTATYARTEFEKNHQEVISLCEKPELVPEIFEELDKALEIYHRILDYIEKHCKEELPEIELKKFSWKPNDWVGWRAEFEDKVLNTDLRSSQKLELLLDALDEEMTSENRYQEVYSHISDILNIPNISSPSSSEYRDMINCVEENLRWLVRHKVDDWNVLLAVLIEQKLDPETRYEWNMKVDRSQLPNIKSLFKFLTDRARALEFHEQLSKSIVCSTSSTMTATRSPQYGDENQNYSGPSGNYRRNNKPYDRSGTGNRRRDM